MASEEASAAPSASIVFVMSEMERGLADAVPRLGVPTRWAAFNAIRQLNKAYKLRETDEEMALFRAITAEEEAATALFRSLRRRGYARADLLRPREHLQKNAVIPFLDAVSRVFAALGSDAPQTRLVFHERQAVPRMEIAIGVPLVADGALHWFRPVPPLHFMMNRESPGDPGPGVNFAEEMVLVASEANATTVMEHLRARANFRNQLLYAGETGVPGINGDADAALREYQRNVFAILHVLFLVDPYPEVQNFVQQGLDAFLQVLGRVPRDIDFG